MYTGTIDAWLSAMRVNMMLASTILAAGCYSDELPQHLGVAAADGGHH